jgi:hypothetical protein
LLEAAFLEDLLAFLDVLEDLVAFLEDLYFAF